MFTLDDLIRSAVQSAINILSPEQHTSVLCVQEVKNHTSTPSSANNINFTTAIQQLHSSSGSIPAQFQQQCGSILPESPPVVEEQQRCVDLSHQHRLYAEQIRKLYEELVNMEREYKDLLEMNVMERKRNIGRLALSGAGGWSASTSDILLLNGLGVHDSKVDSGCEMVDDAVLVNGSVAEEECNGTRQQWLLIN